MQNVGTYTVTRDADSLEGWTGELLAAALWKPMSMLGIEVEYYSNVVGGEGLTLADEDSRLREIAKRTVDAVVEDGPAAGICNLLPQNWCLPVMAEALPEPVRDWYTRSDAFTEDSDGYVYDPELGARPSWADVVEQYLWENGII